MWSQSVIQNICRHSISRLNQMPFKFLDSSRFELSVYRTSYCNNLARYLSWSNGKHCSPNRFKPTLRSRPFAQPLCSESSHSTGGSTLGAKKSWTELPKAESDLWAVLGWDITSWDYGPAPNSEGKQWTELSHDEKNAARALISSNTIPPSHDPQWAKDSFDGAKRFDGSQKRWSELTEQQRCHWRILGWEESTFNYGRLYIYMYLHTSFTHFPSSLPSSLQ